MTPNQESSKQPKICEWRPVVKNTLRGFCTVEFVSGMIIHDIAIHQRDGSRWCSMPGREWAGKEGKQYQPLIEFTDTETRARFRDQVMGALERYFEEAATKTETAEAQTASVELDEKWD